MLDIEQAAKLAQRFLDERAGPGVTPLALVEGERTQVGAVFYFDCQSDAYLRSGDFRDMAIGVGHVAVDGETGKCSMLGAVESAELDLF
ncbi:YrhB domain-containing protein [Streptomyces sp. NPDC006372]|uniref:YrhB domain-containing protein n=1 Tax=Streptomyces sp. NPDC006372 TaxID=3155599 RepID=UPI0033A4B1D4